MPRAIYDDLTSNRVGWEETRVYFSITNQSVFTTLGYTAYRMERIHRPAFSGDIINRRMCANPSDDLVRYIIGDIGRDYPNLPYAIKLSTAFAIYQSILVVQHRTGHVNHLVGRRIQDARY
jgi:hypothetical protein